MWPLLDHFRSHIFIGTTECVSLLLEVCLNRPAKITNFDYVSFFDQYILWFDVSMYKTLSMHVIYSGAGLYEIFECKLLGQILLPPDDKEQIA